MMRWTSHDNRQAFAARVTPFLCRREAAHSLQLAMAGRFAAGSALADDATPPLLLTLESDPGSADDGAAIHAVAIRTPPFPIVLTDLPPAAVDSLIDWLCGAAARAAAGPAARLSGVLAPAEASRRFAAAWANVAGCATPLKHSIRAYELTRVTSPPAVEGAMSPATTADRAMLIAWAAAFGREIHEPIENGAKLINERLSEGHLFVWRVGAEGGVPVAMAALSGATPSGIRVNLVYTPRELRGRGYASNLVAKVSQHALDSGRRFCFLFADNANPTSTGIYLRMGYKPVCDYEKYDFVDARSPA